MAFFKKEELKLLWPFYLYYLVIPMFIFMPAFLVVYFKHIGLNLFQIGLLSSMGMLSTLIFEIPTGAFADLYGRKLSMLLGQFIIGISYLSVFFIREFSILLIAFSFIGIGGTFTSGAEEAWFTDLIKHKNKKFLHGYFIKSNSISSFGMVVSGILGAFLVKVFGVSIIWIAAGFSFLLSLLILVFAQEHFKRKKVRIRDSFKDVIRHSIKSFNYSRKHHVLLYFLIASIFLTIAGSFNSDFAWITLLQQLNFPDYAFGYMWSALGFVGIFAPLVSTKLMKKGKERQFILVVIILEILVLSLIYTATTVLLVLAALLAYYFFFFMRLPMQRVYFHKFIPNKLRATVGSIESMLSSLIMIIIIPIVGSFIDHFGPRISLFMAGLLMIPAVVVYYLIDESKVKEKL